MAKPKIVDLYRLKFGELTVGRRAGKTTRGTVLWHVECSCGEKILVDGARLRRGEKTTCGVNGHYPYRQTTKGLRDENLAEYNLWNNLKQLCYNHKNPYYRWYGKRGARMDEHWRKSFKVFLAAVGKRPSHEHQFRRIDRKGNFEPGNVQWIVPDWPD